MAYEIPWAPLTIAPGVKTILDTMRANRQLEIAQEQADTQAAYAKNAEARESAMEARNKQTFEQQQAKTRADAIKSAVPLMQSSPSAAQMILRAHGIVATPEMKGGLAQPAEVITPLGVLRKAQTPSVDPSMGQHAGAPVADSRMAPASAPMDVSADDATGNQMPLTVPGDVEPDKPTGAFSFKGPKGEDMGRFDPAEEKAFRAQRATEAGAGFGGIDPKYGQLAETLIASGADPQKVGAVIAGAIEHDAQRTAKASEGEENRKMHLTADQTIEQKRLDRESAERRANILARARAVAGGAAPINPAVAEVIRLAEGGAPESEVMAAAAKAKLTSKEVLQPIQNVIKNAAAAERAGQKREALSATGPGIPAGSEWKNPQAANKGNQQVQRFHRVKERLDALIADVEKTGERIGFDSKEYVRRMSLSEAVAAALRPYNELSSTDASMKAERAILGPTGAFGHGWTLGADLATLKHIRDEAQRQQDVNLQTLLKPAGSSALAPSLGGPRGGGGATGKVKMVNKKTGEVKYVTREEADRMKAGTP